MFCPTCGKEFLSERKFCSSCGTNLETVSLALSGSAESAFIKFDNSVDQFLARYSERFFKNAQATAGESNLLKSWKLLLESSLTSVVDLFLLALMWNLLPFRFLMLLVTTPIRAISRGGREKKTAGLSLEEGPITAVPIQKRELGPPSVTEHTTEIISPKADVRQTH